MKKIAIVTGASRGIGAAIAKEFGKQGYHLMLVCEKQTEKLNKIAEEIRSEAGVCVETRVGSVGDSSFVNQVIADTISVYGQIDVLVNNAGISMVGLLQDMSDDEWNQILSVNLNSAFYASRAVIPHMVKQNGGTIINISSVWGCVGASCEVAYSATKGGINSMTMALAKELAPSHIAVNAIACGAVDTEMNGHLDADEKQAVADEIPYGRFATPEEIGEAAVHLAMMPSYLTGQVIKMDGGWQ